MNEHDATSQGAASATVDNTDPHAYLERIFTSKNGLTLDGAAKKEFDYVYHLAIGHFLKAKYYNKRIDVWNDATLGPPFRTWAEFVVGAWSDATLRIHGSRSPSARDVFRGAWKAAQEVPSSGYCAIDRAEHRGDRAMEEAVAGESENRGPLRWKRIVCTAFSDAYPDDPGA